VRELQRHLNRHGARDNENKTLDVDGRFGPRTEQALIRFQINSGLPVTGTTDKDTWTVLRKGAAADQPKPAPETPTATPTNTHKVGPKDTLTNIAKRYDTTVAMLVQLNNIKNPDIIITGSYLILPCGSNPQVPAAPGFKEYIVRVNTVKDPLRVRRSPMGDVLGSVAKNKELTVIAERRHTDGTLWREIRHTAPTLNNGWVSGAHTERIA
jgi:peptidoglycan hydrolase-like protein with peptidoglycan-binding domain